ncbi:LysR family transcriptional regulator [Streptomyces sp. NPDC091272]|uniref:LysR family transcriptional regulator n=1 Tax=Streptomyces sp. NPDC091272 TaxID=3365981 RepID=UPI00380D5BF4
MDGATPVYNLRRLQLLRELKHRGTLAAVAAAMSYSPSSVSQQLTLLESEVGAPLLEREGRGVRLTPQAEILVAHTEAVVRRLDLAGAEIAASLRGLSGTLRVAAFQTAALVLVPVALGTLRTTHPGVRVEVVQAEPDRALPALLVRDVELVIDETFPGHPRAARAAEFENHVLCEDPMRLAADSAGESLRSLADRPWIMEPLGTPARDWAMRVCREAGFEPDVVFQSPDMLVHARMAEAGHAVAFLPDLVWCDRAPSVPLRHLTPTHRRTITVTTRTGWGGHPLAAAFLRALHHAVEHTGAEVRRHLPATP